MGAPEESEVEAQLTRLLYRQSKTGSSGNMVIAAVTLIVVWSQGLPWFTTVPFFSVIAVYAHRLYRAAEFGRIDRPDSVLPAWRRRFVLSSLAAGLSWGSLGFAAYPFADLQTRIYFISIACGLTAAGTSTLAAVPRAYLAYLLPFFTGLIGAVLALGLGSSHWLGALFLFYVAIMAKTARETSRTIAEAVRLGIENRGLVRELTEARDRAQAANEAKTEFLAKMSHEIRTPMNGILGMTELLCSAPLPPQEMRFAQAAHQSGEALLHIINDILDLSRIEAGKVELEKLPFDVHKTAADVLMLFGVSAEKKGLVLRGEIDPSLPARWIGDPSRLRQILSNLVGNAVKFTERGSIELRVDREGDALRFSVKDTGLGISASDRARLFSRFEQANNSISRRFGGSGLGLAITRELVELMGGKIDVESAEGRGSTFFFTLRLEAASEPAPIAEPKPVLAVERLLGNARVLVADDNAVNRAVMTAMLGRIGITPLVVDGGPPALEALRRDRFDLVLVDCEMPEIDGLTLTREVRKWEKESPSKQPQIIVAVTAHALEQHRLRCLESGMNDVVCKPISINKLKSCLDRWLNVAAA